MFAFSILFVQDFNIVLVFISFYINCFSFLFSFSSGFFSSSRSRFRERLPNHFRSRFSFVHENNTDYVIWLSLVTRVVSSQVHRLRPPAKLRVYCLRPGSQNRAKSQVDKYEKTFYSQTLGGTMTWARCMCNLESVNSSSSNLPYFHNNTTCDMYDFTYHAPILWGIIVCAE